MADMLSYCDFTSRPRPTAAGWIAPISSSAAGGQRIVVDAKTPLEAYRAATRPSTSPPPARLAEHGEKGPGHIDALAQKITGAIPPPGVRRPLRPATIFSRPRCKPTPLMDRARTAASWLPRPPR